jgi:uncharacterized membrane protein
MTETSSDDGKTVAIISYITIIGWIIALILNNNNKTEFGSFHIRQSLGIIIVAIGLAIVNSFIGIAMLGWIIQIAILIYWILGFIGAVQGEKKPVPYLGEQFQEWFKGVA